MDGGRSAALSEAIRPSRSTYNGKRGPEGLTQAPRLTAADVHELLRNHLWAKLARRIRLRPQSPTRGSVCTDAHLGALCGRHRPNSWASPTLGRIEPDSQPTETLNSSPPACTQAVTRSRGMADPIPAPSSPALAARFLRLRLRRHQLRGLGPNGPSAGMPDSEAYK